MALPANPQAEELAFTLAKRYGISPEEAILAALQKELQRTEPTPLTPGDFRQEPTFEDLRQALKRLGPWTGPSSAELTSELYAANGLPR